MVFKRLFHKKEPADDISQIRQSILAMSQVPGLEALVPFIHEHPELLANTATAELNNLIRTAYTQNQQQVAHKLEMCQYLLYRCRVVGIEQAFGELQRPSQYYPYELKTIMDQIERMQRPEDIPDAIQLCQSGLKLVDREQNPFAWVWLHYNMGLCYLNNPLGVRNDNLEVALEAFQTALSSCNRGWYSYTWGCIQISIGDVYTQRIKGNHAENFEFAIQASEAALDIFQSHRPSKELAQAHAVRGYAYSNRLEGQQADNLEQAIQSYLAALAIKEFKAESILWANTQLNLCAAYIRRYHGDMAENIDLAIQASQAALTVFTREATPEQWATALNNLGLAYRNRIHGDHAENLELAIQAYQEALTVISPSRYALVWSETQNHLGIAYLYRVHGDRTENIEQALQCFQAALTVCTPEENPAEWALIQNNLALGFYYRIKGDRAENQEAAISVYRSALTIYSRDFLPDKWAMAQNNLGLVYTDRMRGDAVENHNLAIQAYRAALEVYTQNDFPMDWAMTQMNLGVAYAKAYLTAAAGNQSENLAYALTAYQAALNVYTREDYPERWAGVQANLGILYATSLDDSKGDFPERAIQALESALSIYDPQSYPEQRIQAYINLGRAYFFREQGSTAENLERAAQAFQTALEQAQAASSQTYVLQSAASLGRLYHLEGRLADAYATLETAIAVLDRLRFAYFTEDTKIILAEEHHSLYELMVDTCLRLEKTSRALETIEASKARVFLEQLGHKTFPVPLLPASQQSLVDKEIQLVEEAHALSQSMRVPGNETYRISLVSQLEQTRDALERVWDQLQSYTPDYVALRRGDPITLEHMQLMVDHLGCKAALMDFYALPSETVAFILRTDAKEAIPLEIPVTASEKQLELDNYQREVPGYRFHGDIGQRWQELARPLLGKTLSYLEGVELIYLVPHGFLHHLPLHALQAEPGYLIDYAPIVYAPSLAVLKRVMEGKDIQPQTKKQAKALVIGYTPHEDERALFEGEAEKVAEQLHTRPYLGKDATVQLLRETVEPYDVLHISCHGFFNSLDPLASGLLLADGVLTARDIMSMKLKADLVTLSACQTGVSTPLAGDELVGLTRALLYAGVSSVLVTLWSVNAQAALELIADFYSRQAARNATKAAALQQAMLHIRARRPHPYFWAPFILVGNWR